MKFTPRRRHASTWRPAARAKRRLPDHRSQDNGPGIPREKLDKIFTPFSQVDNRYDRQAGGTGLGLALVRGLAELHGGRAWLESESGKGCRAYVVLPVNALEAESKGAAAA